VSIWFALSLCENAAVFKRFKAALTARTIASGEKILRNFALSAAARFAVWEKLSRSTLRSGRYRKCLRHQRAAEIKGLMH
jgi:hypothetical protein